MLNIGTKAPDFELETVSSFSSLPIKTRLEDFKGKWLILFFYPYDFSIVCPTEIRGMNRSLSEFEAKNTEVLAVSTDSIYTHRAWIKSTDKNGVGEIDLQLASDFSKEVSKAYDVLNEDTTAANRATFIIDPEGIIQYSVMTNGNVGRSAAETLRVLEALQSGGMCPMDWKVGEETMNI